MYLAYLNLNLCDLAACIYECGSQHNLFIGYTSIISAFQVRTVQHYGRHCFHYKCWDTHPLLKTTTTTRWRRRRKQSIHIEFMVHTLSRHHTIDLNLNYNACYIQCGNTRCLYRPPSHITQQKHKYNVALDTHTRFAWKMATFFRQTRYKNSVPKAHLFVMIQSRLVVVSGIRMCCVGVTLSAHYY